MVSPGVSNQQRCRLLRGTHLEGATFYGVHLDQANLRGAHLEKADLAWAHLERLLIVPRPACGLWI